MCYVCYVCIRGSNTLPPLDFQQCSHCKEFKDFTEFYKDVRYRSGYHSHCRLCNMRYCFKYQAKRKKKDGRFRLLLSSYNNARRKGLVHTIKVGDIPRPETCIYLGVALDWDFTEARKWYNPSIDRIDPTKGYTPDNIQVISDLANSMKQNATVDQLLAFARGVLRQHGAASEE